MADYMKTYEQWVNSSFFDEDTKKELQSIAGDEAEIRERFYMDLECNVHQEGILGLLCELERSCDSFTLLGNYTEIV